MNAQEEKNARPKQILIADDEQSVGKVYQRIITGHFPDWQVDLVANGFDAIEAFRRKRHDVVIMDIHMPVMDGAQAEYEIREFCEEREIPEPAIIFCTGYLPPDGVREIVETNPCCSLLLKPIAMDTLIKEIERRLELGGSGDKAQRGLSAATPKEE
ncbi:MAG: response regulator [Verrucomicrobiota bacterium]|nr:response regulator [Verrucomicrobiota bacterium]